jgi:HK97 gp10 family phage protein
VSRENFLLTVRGDRMNETVFARIRGGEVATRRSIRRAFFELGKDLKAEANREILRRPKHGRTYIVRGRSGRPRRHVASAPGETHANLSGRLRRSISWKVHGDERMEFGYGVSTTDANAAPEYDLFVEYGTSRMAARPSLRNAIDATQSHVERDFQDAMTRAFEKGAAP